MTHAVRRILMLKGHSAGIGDLLRSTPAWRALKDRYGGDVELHLVLFTNDPGYVSEGFIAKQALLQGLTVIPRAASGLRGWRLQLQALRAAADRFKPDLVIDFEPHGLRSASLTAVLGMGRRIASVGIAQFPGRRLFYGRAAPAARFKWPDGNWYREIDYTDRDFAALKALGIGREGRAIEMSVTPEGHGFGLGLRQRLGWADDLPLVGVNIGCGTPNAAYKRPGTELLAALCITAQRELGAGLVLTGAPNERTLNEDFEHHIAEHISGPITNLAGETGLYELAGVIQQCRLFISSDSGPYHMAVALRRPTLALFNMANHQAFHDAPWVRRVVRGAGAKDDLPAALDTLHDLLRATSE